MTPSANELQRDALAADGRRMKIDGLAVYHLTAKLDRTDVSLSDFDVAEWLWPKLRAAFPIALASAVMPDHPHLVSPLEDPERGRVRLNRLLGQLARRLGIRHLGEAAEPSPIVDRPKLLRHLRYVGLNAPREDLADDPLSWLFSTHRDVIGATIDPWVDASRLAHALQRPVAGFVEWYQGYVSADPSVAIAGTPAPRPALATDIPRFPLATIVRATAAAVRARPESIRRAGLLRDLFVGLAREQGWRNWDALAQACACSTRAIRRSAEHAIDLAPARLCLGDRRLLVGVPRWRDDPGRRLASGE